MVSCHVSEGPAGPVPAADPVPGVGVPGDDAHAPARGVVAALQQDGDLCRGRHTGDEPHDGTDLGDEGDCAVGRDEAEQGDLRGVRALDEGPGAVDQQPGHDEHHRDPAEAQRGQQQVVVDGAVAAPGH